MPSDIIQPPIGTAQLSVKGITLPPSTLEANPNHRNDDACPRLQPSLHSLAEDLNCQCMRWDGRYVNCFSFNTTTLTFH
ncbi:hypothetical protein BDZ89DRAFT_1071593 [Hymenopellis radicata]|nr:hypothetical protein BDZ89DRAFT_1071593 [Hymenopellis radicata]